MKIKILLAALALSSVLCAPVQAQDEMENRHEISVSYGVAPNTRRIAFYRDVMPHMYSVEY